MKKFQSILPDMTFFGSVIFLFACLMPTLLIAQIITPLQGLSAFKYKGAFLLTPPAGTLNNSRGIIDVNPKNNSIIHMNFGGLTEYPIPEIVNSENIADLKTNTTVIQTTRRIYEPGVNLLNPNGNDRDTGVKLIDNKIVMNSALFYDGTGQNRDTTYIVENASDIANSATRGFLRLQGAVHSAGWISEIPTYYQDEFGDSTYIFGFSSELAINGRSSLGPTAFLVDKNQLFSGIIDVPAFALMDFGLSNPLIKPEAALLTAEPFSWNNYGYNTTALIYKADGTAEAPRDADGNVITIGNDMWTEMSAATFGFIVPGTSTYAVFGWSAGHDSGIGYKIIQDNGVKCGGPCPYDPNDVYNHYWFFDVDDFIEVRNGTKQASSIVPYDYGKFPVPFQFNPFANRAEFHPIGGGAFDKTTNTLYLSIRDGGKVGAFDNPPVFLAYEIDVPYPPNPPTNLNITVK